MQVHAQQAGAGFLAHIATGGDENVRQLFSGQGHGGTAKGGDPALSQGGADPVHAAYRAVGKITAPAAAVWQGALRSGAGAHRFHAENGSRHQCADEARGTPSFGLSCDTFLTEKVRRKAH